MPSIFSQEWRDCLRAHYSYVVRLGDEGTEKTLRSVMFEAGFGDDEVKELYVLATAHVDDAGVDFLPDMGIFEEKTAPVVVAVLEVVEAQEIEDEPPLDETAIADLELEDADNEPPKTAPDVTQLSLF